MFLHGSRSDLNIGDVLVPGVELGRCDNGGKNEHVYLVSTDGFSLSECEDAEGYSSAFEFAVSEALWWGNDKFVYVVEPIGKMSYDDNHDVSPACVRSESAKIVNKYDSSLYSFDDLVELLNK